MGWGGDLFGYGRNDCIYWFFDGCDCWNCYGCVEIFVYFFVVVYGYVGRVGWWLSYIKVGWVGNIFVVFIICCFFWKGVIFGWIVCWYGVVWLCWLCLFWFVYELGVIIWVNRGEVGDWLGDV